MPEPKPPQDPHKLRRGDPVEDPWFPLPLRPQPRPPVGTEEWEASRRRPKTPPS